MPFNWAELGTADAVALAVGLALAVGFLLPLVATALGFRILRFTAIDDPKLAEPDGTDAEYAERVRELVALGFRPAGEVRETTWLYGHEFRKCHRVPFLVSADGTTYAAVYRLGFGPGGMLRTALDTATDAGTLVQTAFPGAGLTTDEPDYHRTEEPWTDAAAALEAHRRHVATVTAEGGGTPARAALADLAEIDERTSLRALRAIDGTGLAQLLFGVGWLVPFLGAAAILAVGADFGWPRRLAASLLFAAGC